MREKLQEILPFIGAAGSLLGIIVAVQYSSVSLDNNILPKLLLSIGAAGLAFIFGYFYKWYHNRERLTIFISHAMKDAELAREFAARLRGDRFWVILPEEKLNVGDNIIDKVNEQIANSDSIIALLSPQAIKSEWVQKELNIARDKQRKIFPVLLEGAELPKAFQDILYVKLGDSVDETVLKLEEAILKSTARAT